jgi:D-lactate dehydrogenase (cytochrome)
MKNYIAFQESTEVGFLLIHKQVPIVPYGGATSIEGHTLSPNGGVCIDMSLMKVCIISLYHKS